MVFIFFSIKQKNKSVPHKKTALKFPKRAVFSCQMFYAKTELTPTKLIAAVVSVSVTALAIAIPLVIDISVVA
jgi:hypothetical protein